MFIITLTYQTSLDIIDQYLAQHRENLDICYAKGWLLASGPQNPRIGGLLISPLADRDLIDKLIKQDPFFLHNIADYKVIEFNPVKASPTFYQAIEDAKKLLP